MNESLRTSIAKQFRNTALGFLRIKRNLGLTHLTDSATEELLRKIVLSAPIDEIQTKGKNHYFKCRKYNTILTVNSSTFTVITAKEIEKGKQTAD